MRRRRCRRRLRARSRRPCSPFERKNRRFLSSRSMPERCIPVWNLFSRASGSSPSRITTCVKTLSLRPVIRNREYSTRPAAMSGAGRGRAAWRYGSGGAIVPVGCWIVGCTAAFPHVVRGRRPSDDEQTKCIAVAASFCTRGPHVPKKTQAPLEELTRPMRVVRIVTPDHYASRRRGPSSRHRRRYCVHCLHCLRNAPRLPGELWAATWSR